MLKEKNQQKYSLKTLNVTFTDTPKLKYPLFGYVSTLYLNYKKGTLPYQGSLSEQPAKVIEIFNTLDQLAQEAQVREQKKKEKDNNQSVK
jgi:hypothetical protein